MLGLEEGQDLYVESTFSLVSEFSCTDQVSLCLEALYKIYLSSKKEEFREAICSLPKIFRKTVDKSVCKFESKFFNINWKANTSYPNTSVTHMFYSAKCNLFSLQVPLHPKHHLNSLRPPPLSQNLLRF